MSSLAGLSQPASQPTPGEVTHQECEDGQAASVASRAAGGEHVVGPSTVVPKHLCSITVGLETSGGDVSGMAVAVGASARVPTSRRPPSIPAPITCRQRPLHSTQHSLQPSAQRSRRTRAVGADEHAAIVGDALPHGVAVSHLHLQVLGGDGVADRHRLVHGPAQHHKPLRVG